MLTIPKIWLNDDEDIELAKAVEAGVYAAHLIGIHGPSPDLERVTELGRQAMERLWWAGARVALSQAKRVALGTGLPEEELFQEACVAVAEAIRRYDFTRGRFITLTYEFVRRALAEVGGQRLGRPTSTRRDRVCASRLAKALDAQLALGEHASAESTAHSIGVSWSAAIRGGARLVSLDEAAMADPRAEASFESVGEDCLDFLSLLKPQHQRVLKLRFGLQGPALTLKALARELGTSVSTASRWERDAIAAARQVLTAERTTSIAIVLAAAAIRLERSGSQGIRQRRSRARARNG